MCETRARGAAFAPKLALSLSRAKRYLVGPTGLWVGLFIFSKFPELLDTAFLVLQKKRVIFLHWFHHTTVLLYCWHAYHNRIGPGIWSVRVPPRREGGSVARAREHHARVGRGPGRGQARKVQLDYPGRRAQGHSKD